MAINSRRAGFIISIVIILAICWFFLIGYLSNSGYFLDLSTLPPRPVLIILFPLPFVLIFAFSAKAMRFIRLIPGHWLIYMQAFRIPVEIILWLSYKQGLLPVQMTFEGINFDALSGILAAPVGYYCFVKRKWSLHMALIYNCLGLLLLVNILIVSALSMPTPYRYFMNDPSNTIIAVFPFIYLPGLLVPLAYTLHIISLRQLFMMKSNT